METRPHTHVDGKTTKEKTSSSHMKHYIRFCGRKRMVWLGEIWHALSELLFHTHFMSQGEEGL